MPTQQLSRDVCHSGQSCVCSQCSIADHAQKLKHSHVMWLETTIRNRYIGQSYWDTHYSAKSCNGAEKYSTLVWKRENKNNPLNTLVKEIFFYILSYMRNFRPSSKVELFMYWTWSLQLNTWGDRCLNQLSPTYIIQRIKSGTHENFDCGATWFQTSNLLCAKPDALLLQYNFIFQGKQCTCTPLYFVGRLNQLSNMNGWPE